MRKVIKFIDVKCIVFISVASKFIESHCISMYSTLDLIYITVLNSANLFIACTKLIGSFINTASQMFESLWL